MASATPYWITNPRAWDIVRIDGRPLPGISRVSGADITLMAQEKRGRSKDGASHGPPLLKRPDFVIEWVLTRRDRNRSGMRSSEVVWLDAVQWVRNLIPIKHPTDRDYIRIEHPLLSLVGISYALPHKIDVKPPSANGPVVILIHCWGYRPPVKDADHTPVVKPPPPAPPPTIGLANTIVRSPELRETLKKPSGDPGY